MKRGRPTLPPVIEPTGSDRHVQTHNDEQMGFLHKSRNSRQRGLVYRHSWGKGFQDLVFPSHDAAMRFLHRKAIPC